MFNCTNYKWYSCSYFLKQELLDKPEEVERIFEDEELLELSLTMEHLPDEGWYLVKERSIGPGEGAVLGVWKKFQYDDALSRSNLRYLREACTARLDVGRQKAVGGVLELSMVLRPHEIRLIHVQPEG